MFSQKATTSANILKSRIPGVPNIFETKKVVPEKTTYRLGHRKKRHLPSLFPADIEKKVIFAKKIPEQAP
jgi:hypothetical protein